MESEGQTINLAHQKLAENPEDEQIKCRICYDFTRPLISVCDCSGTIAFVHEDCILDWITKKIEASERVEIPECEICHQKYSARMKVGKKKICYKILLQKIKNLEKQEIVTSLVMFLLFLVSLAVIAFFIVRLFLGYLQITTLLNFFSELFFKIISPYFILKAAKDHFRRRKRLADDSVIQIVQVTLMPKIALRK